ncbi:hypothetical protein [Mesorhizobium sp. M1396]
MEAGWKRSSERAGEFVALQICDCCDAWPSDHK